MLQKFKTFAAALAITLVGLLAGSPDANAQIDVTPITDALGDAGTAVTAVMAAAAVVWGLMVAIKYLKRVASSA